MQAVLRVGIIGLGRRWQKRYKPALRALRSRFRVRAVSDHVPQRAAREATDMACDMAAGPTQLLEREDVDAVLILDGQWFGLWPLEGACRTGKPVFCASSLERDDARADALHQHVQEHRLPVVMEMAPRFAPVTAWLQSLFETELGAPRLLRCEVVHSRKVPSRFDLTQAAQPSPVNDWFGGTAIALLDWCARLLGGEPVNVTARGLKPIGFSSFFLEFAGGRGVQITRRPQVADRPAVRLEIVAERGSAWAQWPSQVSWTTHEGFHSRTLRGQDPLAMALLEHFRAALEGNAALEPTLADAYRLLRWLRKAVQSLDEGRLVTFTSTTLHT